MKTITHNNAQEFLKHTSSELETQEAANSLMLGICGQLINLPGYYKSAPCLKTVENEQGLVLAALMTPPHKLVACACQEDIEGAVRMLVSDLVEESWPLPGVRGPSQIAEQIARCWVEITGGGRQLARRSKLYELHKVLIPAPAHGSLRSALMADLELVTRWWVAFSEDIGQAIGLEEVAQRAHARIDSGDIYLWEIDGHPVSMAMKIRPTRRGISVSLVYTPPELRRRGYATACVGELSRMLLASGCEYCALFADAANLTANRVYTQIGYTPISDHEDFTFSGV